MSIPSDQKALLFLAAVAVLGAGVRVAKGEAHPSSADPGALERQMQAADSARRSGGARRKAGGNTGSAPGAGGRAKHGAAGTGERTIRVPVGSAAASARGRPPAAAATTNPHRDFRGRLDMDVASATELDSLPGLGPTLARRIVADRMAHGPFVDLAALRRVKGVSTKLLERLDSTVTFSGTIRPANPEDTIIGKKKRVSARQRAIPP